MSAHPAETSPPASPELFSSPEAERLIRTAERLYDGAMAAREFEMTSVCMKDATKPRRRPAVKGLVHAEFRDESGDEVHIYPVYGCGNYFEGTSIDYFTTETTDVGSERVRHYFTASGEQGRKQKALDTAQVVISSRPLILGPVKVRPEQPTLVQQGQVVKAKLDELMSRKLQPTYRLKTRRHVGSLALQPVPPII